jgi:predicted metal-dependent HD superfamily phosphohydrolase
MERCIYLWKNEWLSEEELEILALAWLFHDTWFIIQYDDNENIWAWIARNYLKSVLYSEDKINKIEELIIATIYTRNPENLLESIIRDADTDNLWRDDFFDKWQRLKKEIEEIKNIKILDPDWKHYSINLLRQHRFMTPTEINERENKKQENLKKLLTINNE